MLGSNDYLGLAALPEAMAAATEALSRHGVGLALNPPLATTFIHEQLRGAIADLHATESALLFNSCTSANVAVACTLVGEGDRIMSDRLNHASIIDGCRLSRATTQVYEHQDFEQLERLLRAATSRRTLVLTDGVFSMEGSAVNLPRLAALCQRHEATLVVDDSHGAGVIGREGRGTAFRPGAEAAADIYTGTFSKAFGAATGGYAAGSAEVIRALHDFGRFWMFTTPMSPSSAAAALAAVRHLRQAPALVDKLRHNALRLREGLARSGFELLGGDSPITPILVGSEEKAVRMSAELLALGVYIAAIGFPIVPRGQARLRAQPSATHSESDIDEAIDKIAAAGRRVGIIGAG